MHFHPGTIIRASIDRDMTGRDAMRLYAWAYDNASPWSSRAYLGEDGNWHDIPRGDEGTIADPPQGWIVPHGLKQALIDSLAEHMDAGAEQELRRALDLAERRVDRLIDKALS